MFANLDTLIFAFISLAAGAAGFYYYKRHSTPRHLLAEPDVAADMSQIAMTDTLTQLPNRRAFEQQLAAGIRRCSRQESSLAVAFIDLDDFKPINDTYGHHVGDEVLRIVAQRLNSAVRHCDLVGRIGGDEFLALIEDIKSSQDIVTIIERVISTLRDVLYVQHHELHISASVGIAVYPRDGDIKQLMIAADSAMYHAKNMGKNQFCFYDKEMGLASDRLLELQKDLKNALERNEFELYYQPKVDSRNFSLTGVEALLRWQHPTKGWIAPNVFIPAAGRFGLMNRISHWVVEESCRTLLRMRSMGIHLQISINLAAQQFRNPETVNNILEVLKRFNLPNSCLMFETGEQAAWSSSTQFNACLEQFRNAGIDVAMDNFGAGYTTIDNLQQFNVNQLKLDQSITGKIADDRKFYEMADALIRLAHAMDLVVVAKGVETAAQSELLEQLDCDQLQGYLFGRPVPEERLPLLIKQISALQR